jgi:ATP-binding cassette subfamily C protein
LNIAGLSPSLPAMLGLIVVGITAKSIILMIAMKQAGYAVAHVTSDLRLNLIKALLAARWSYFVSQPSGHFANAISSEAMRASSAFHHSLLLISAFIQVTVYGIVALWVSWKITLLSLLAVAMLIFVLKNFVKMSRGAGTRQTELMKTLIVRLTEMLQGIKPIKAMAREDHIQILLEVETQDINKAQQRHVFASESMKAFQEPLLAIMIAVGIYAVTTFGKQSFPTLLVMVFLFHHLINRVYFAQACYQDLVMNESALWSLLRAIEDTRSEREIDTGHTKPLGLENEIMLNSVKFSYGKKAVLKNVTMNIPAGYIVAIIGNSGSGKTTIADLIIGLFRPQSGSITVDGNSLDELSLLSWRQLIGYVPQEMFLFHDNIYNNIASGDETITRADVEDALKLAGAWDFVSSLPSGMDSVVGERGSKLSGGQRQRLALARALARKPKLLILDEATTALDPETEKAICQTLSGLSGKVTILAISHQPAIMEVADKVYSLKNGVIEELDSSKTLPEFKTITRSF